MSYESTARQLGHINLDKNTIGNNGGVGIITSLINPVPFHDFTFETYSDMGNGEGEVSWLVKGWIDGLGKVTIESDCASALRLFAPTLVQTGSIFKLGVAVTDDFDSRAYPAYEGSVYLQDTDQVSGLPTSISYTAADNCTKVVEGLTIPTFGIYRITGTLPGYGDYESNPIVVRDNVDEPIYWGNIHNHGCYSECWGG